MLRAVCFGPSLRVQRPQGAPGSLRRFWLFPVFGFVSLERFGLDENMLDAGLLLADFLLQSVDGRLELLNRKIPGDREGLIEWR